jgi:soluble lytic murein transglycosylase-like protein
MVNIRVMAHTFWVILLSCNSVFADPVKTPVPQAKIEKCLLDASKAHRVPYGILRSIAKEESSFQANAVGVNPATRTRGYSEDTGLMGVNDWWLPTLAQYGITRQTLKDPCVSAYVGAWILRQEIKKHGMTWRAVGYYNSRSEYSQKIYTRKIAEHLQP